MAHPKRKQSRMKRHQRKAANAYKGVQATFCPACGTPVVPHRVCSGCGQYNGTQVVAVDSESEK